jgi:pimeloyl-ACP methyl ester carboxylesterase
VFDGWGDRLLGLLPGVTVSAVDLQRGLRPETATMSLYAGTIVAEAGRLPFPLVLVGWSMGGLAAMMAAGHLRPAYLVLLEPSPPSEIQGAHPEVQPQPGTYDPGDAYGHFPAGIPSRPESSPARDERKRGVSVPALPGPTLAVFGDEFPEDRGRAIVRRYGADELYLPGLSHWDLVLDPRVPGAVAAHIQSRFR